MKTIRWIVLGLASAALLGAAPDTQLSVEAFHKAQVQMGAEGVAKAEAHYQGMTNDVAATRNDLRQMTGLVDVSPEAFRKAITRLQEEQEKLQLEEAGAQGRREGLSDAINKLTTQVRQAADTDAAVEELKQMLSLREKEFQRIQQLAQAHAVSQQAIDDAQAKVAEARLKLIEVRRQAVGTSNAESLEIWNRELTNLSIAERERDARLKFIQGRLERLSKAVPYVDRLESLISGQRYAEQTLREAQSLYERIRSGLPGAAPAQ